MGLTVVMDKTGDLSFIGRSFVRHHLRGSYETITIVVIKK